jgi:hypothetical protein
MQIGIETITPEQAKLYQRTQRAIKGFMNGEELKLIKPASEDIYPIRELI